MCKGICGSNTFFNVFSLSKCVLANGSSCKQCEHRISCSTRLSLQAKHVWGKNKWNKSLNNSLLISYQVNKNCTLLFMSEKKKENILKVLIGVLLAGLVIMGGYTFNFHREKNENIKYL